MSAFNNINPKEKNMSTEYNIEIDCTVSIVIHEDGSHTIELFSDGESIVIENQRGKLEEGSDEFEQVASKAFDIANTLESTSEAAYMAFDQPFDGTY